MRRLSGAIRINRGPEPTPRAEQYFFAATRLSINKTQSSSGLTTGNESSISRVFFSLPDYAIRDGRFLLRQTWVDETGVTSPEKDITTPATVHLSVERGGVFFPATLAGKSSRVLGGGEFIWTDPLTTWLPPATANAFARTIHTAAIGDRRPFGTSRLSLLSDGRELTVSPQTAKLTSGSISTSFSGAVYAPEAFVAKGNPGTRVALVISDSIGCGLNETGAVVTARGCVGMIARGLDENVIGPRVPFGHFGVPGTRPSGQSSANFGAMKRRLEALFALPNLPFDFIICQLGVNDANADFATWRNNMLALWNFLSSCFPGKPIYQLTLTPRVTVTGNFRATNLANQVPANDARLELNDYIRTNPAPLAGHIDVAPAFADANEPGKWKLRPFTAQLTAEATSGQAIAIMDAKPERGELIVFGNSTAGVQITQVNNAVDNGNGTFTVTCVDNIATTRAVGHVVRATPTDDTPNLVHPGALPHMEAANIIAAVKSRL